MRAPNITARRTRRTCVPVGDRQPLVVDNAKEIPT